MSKIGVVLTTHKNNLQKILTSTRSVIENCTPNRKIIVFDNEGPEENKDILLTNFPEIEYIHIDDQRKMGGLTYTWNEGIRKCLEDNCETVILLNHDIKCNHTFRHLIVASLNKEKEGIYSCTTNKAPWGNHLNQQSYIQSDSILVNEHYNEKGPGGFCLAIPKEVLLKNKFDDYNFFDPKFPFDGNELFYNRRWYNKGGKVYIVRSCFIYHSRDNSWTKIPWGNAQNIRNGNI